MTRPLRFRRDTRGVTIIEFGMIAPVMMMAIMGLGDMLYQVYAQSILVGAVQKAGRDAGVQGGALQGAALDADVIRQMGGLMPVATQSCAANPAAGTWCATRENFDTFGDVHPEPVTTDVNGNGIPDVPGDCFIDVNGNGVWDRDLGSSGQGGADDVTLYTMTVTYPRLFPVAGLLGWSPNATISATTLLKNQPYAQQVVNTRTSNQVCL